MVAIANLMPWAGMVLLIACAGVLAWLAFRHDKGTNGPSRRTCAPVPLFLLLTVLAVILGWALGNCHHFFG